MLAATRSDKLSSSEPSASPDNKSLRSPEQRVFEKIQNFRNYGSYEHKEYTVTLGPAYYEFGYKKHLPTTTRFSFVWKILSLKSSVVTSTIYNELNSVNIIARYERDSVYFPIPKDCFKIHLYFHVDTKAYHKQHWQQVDA